MCGEMSKVGGGRRSRLDSSSTLSMGAVNTQTAPKLTSKAATEDEFQFWLELTSGRNSPLPEIPGAKLRLSRQSSHQSSCFGGSFETTSSRSGTEDFGGNQFGLAAVYDTSPQHIEKLYEKWAPKGILTEQIFKERLEGCALGLSLTDDQLRQALERVQGGAGKAAKDSDSHCDRIVPRTVFASLWQRLTLGVLCQMSETDGSREVRLIEYNESDFRTSQPTEREFLFGVRARGGGDRCSNVNGRVSTERFMTRWAQIMSTREDLLMRICVKFWLHPLATQDVVHAAREGTTKVDRYRHQYFVSLEVYALDLDELDWTADPPAVNTRIARSMITLVATGNPPTRSGLSSSRDWLLTIIDAGHNCNSRKNRREDPLNRFRNDVGAAKKVCGSVRGDLRTGGRLREYQADFLLYAIINRAAQEMTPIYHAYGQRLRWLQDRLDAGKLSIPRGYIDEVSKVRLEILELRQWLRQMKSVLHHLENDCNPDSCEGGDVPWNFGADARGKGRGMLLFLRHTQDFLGQAGDRLVVLDDLARSFCDDNQRYRSDFMNRTLFLLTVATAVFMPMQFMAGVYGMNFTREDGMPAMWEARQPQGYTIFWLAMLGWILLVLAAVTWAYCVFRRPKAVDTQDENLKSSFKSRSRSRARMS